MSANRRPITIRSPRLRPWSVFDAVRSFPSTPDALMSEIDAAIASTEYSRASSPPLNTTTSSSTSSIEEAKAGSATSAPASTYDAQIADEAYKAACAALAAGRPDAAARSLQVALESCPPDKVSAVAKLRSLVAIANSQLQKKLQKQPLLR
ncbi:hypothetical protein LUZ62_030154 [Rhynchospora pubera]|uniref:Uncharacterized protein n=1 Tax=Rhynchospora pubera TaxID=906938 RepID=A0AAV8HI84_9POAL|nr:hypothetical protein LUZ62_030154 [Rhynchospora pubera]